MQFKRIFVLFFLILLLFYISPANLQAADTALTLIKITGGSLAVVEIGHLIYGLIKKIRFQKKIKHKNPPIQTNLIATSHETNVDLGEYNNLFLNLGDDTNSIISTNTNLVLATNSTASNMIIKNVVSNVVALVTNLVTTNTNKPLINYDTNLILTHNQITNLTEQEKQDIELFGRDYYYLVALAYFRVKKYNKSREFMLHSLAIGEKIVEGKQFLKKNFKFSDKDIEQGIKKYTSLRK